MTAAVNLDGATVANLTGISVRIAGGLKTVTDGLVRLSRTSIVAFYAKLRILLSTFNAIGRGNSAAVVTVISEPVTANVAGAIGDIIYAWTRTAPDAHAWTITSPDQATTTFSTLAAQGESWNATFICTITDSAGQVLASAPVAVNCANIYYGGGYVGTGGSGGGGEYP
jgi:hypothetical protein